MCEFSAHTRIYRPNAGVRRSGVTVAAKTLSRAGIIRYQRGYISILNREDLSATSCECYEVIQGEFARLLGY